MNKNNVNKTRINKNSEAVISRGLRLLPSIANLFNGFLTWDTATNNNNKHCKWDKNPNLNCKIVNEKIHSILNLNGIASCREPSLPNPR